MNAHEALLIIKPSSRSLVEPRRVLRSTFYITWLLAKMNLFISNLGLGSDSD